MNPRARSRTFAALPLLGALMGASGGSGCSGGGVTEPDAGTTPGARLVVTRDSVGLPFSGRGTLEVRYQTEEGEPIVGAAVQFAMVTSGSERTGGSTLSASTAHTDALGYARVDVTAGGERARFRVTASAPGAPSAFFYINVSEMGFSHLIVTPVHEGWRPEAGFVRVEVRLYGADEIRCAALDPDDPPPSLSPPRSLDGFGGSVEYEDVSAFEPYTVVSWALVGGSDTRIAIGCVDLGATQLLPTRVRFELAVGDRRARLPATSLLESRFDTAPLAALVAEAPEEAAWRALRCPAGPGQLLLDCTLAALAGDATDCVPGEHPLIAAAETRRGPPDVDGCRPATDDDDPTLDRLLTEAVDAGGFPLGSQLDADRGALLGGFTLLSRLSVDAAGRGDHQLLALSLADGAWELDLPATALPVLRQRPLALTHAGATVEIPAHAFTIRLGAALRRAYWALSLAPAGLAGDAATLGEALSAAARDPGGDAEGCAAVSAIVCGALAEPAGCLDEACAAGSAHADVLLAAWWRLLDGDGLDFELRGAAPVDDHDDDLHGDALGRDGQGAATGAWTARLTPADGEPIELSGSFGATDTVDADPP